MPLIPSTRLCLCQPGYPMDKMIWILVCKLAAPRLPPRFQHISEQVARLNYQLFRVRQPFVLVNTTESLKAGDERYQRYNTDHRLFGIYLLSRLLEAQLVHPADVTYLALYTA
ncbi:hypothetical protein ATEIFO6365_0004001700 [Aspergillus terreus]|uniref:Uncharacterized protein n=1 Tax=Aspergillus terreus TaxID=33178 RepID=A0A5M3YSU7_ASPTE|nr:hypothetical protein ATETN484_0002011600 [Aspergillus terreus]GFF14899.1 hypothetical protein ATEIFO6365_0004001700 [Aspergillus terreus]